MDASHVTAAVAETHRVLGPHTDADWSAPASPLEWSCRDTAVHIAHDLLAYASQLAAAPADAYLPHDLTVRPEATPADILRTVTACGTLLSGVLTTTAPTARAWHWGPCDPAGFAAMGARHPRLAGYERLVSVAGATLPP